jgi:hypothetical protein
VRSSRKKRIEKKSRHVLLLFVCLVDGSTVSDRLKWQQESERKGANSSVTGLLLRPKLS